LKLDLPYRRIRIRNMTDTIQKNIDLANLLDRLPRGSKRKLATVMGCNPGRITDARDGFVKDQDFLSRLAKEALKFLSSPVRKN